MDQKHSHPRYLIVRGSESSSDILIIKNHYFECEVFPQIFYDHHEKRKLDAEGFLRVCRALNKRRAYIGAHDFQYGRLDVRICDTLDVTISNFFIPDLKRLTPAKRSVEMRRHKS